MCLKSSGGVYTDSNYMIYDCNWNCTLTLPLTRVYYFLNTTYIIVRDVVKELYRLMNCSNGGLGGNGSGGHVYGELSKGSMDLVIDDLGKI